MFALALTLVVSASDVVVVERSTLGLSPSQGAQLRARLVLTLEDAKVRAEVLDQACADRACLQALARTRKQVVIGMTVVKSKKGLTVDLDAVDAGAVLLQQTFLISANDKLESNPEAQVFAHQLAAKMVKDAPVVERAKPDVVKPPETIETPPAWVDTSDTKPSAAPKVLGIASAGVGAAGVALLIVGLVMKGQLDGALAEQPYVTSINRAQAVERANGANAALTSGTIALGLGVTGAVTAIILAASE